jgi:precorrin-4/cobalt-precorrin-4 C11-methyltransferase
VISFVGAGPGAADLITLRGAARLAAADVVVWASSLVPEAVLGHVRPGARLLDSAGMTLEDVIGVYSEAGPESRIVRLHSGDPSIYGAIGEQIGWCLANGRDFEVVPGVSSMGAAAAALGRELTVPGVAQSVILTRLPGRTAASVPPAESLAALAAHGTTMAVFLSGARPEELESELRAGGYAPDTPAAVAVRATWPDESLQETTVGRLAATVRATGATRTVLVLVGEALRPASAGGPGVPPGMGRRSRLYAPDFAHAFRRRSDPGSTTGRPA